MHETFIALTLPLSLPYHFRHSISTANSTSTKTKSKKVQSPHGLLVLQKKYEEDGSTIVNRAASMLWNAHPLLDTPSILWWFGWRNWVVDGIYSPEGVAE
jgi:hypothetical protein